MNSTDVSKACQNDIEIKNLFKSYGSKNVLSGISFSVQSGQVMGFLGANGTGKSTTMNILTGYLSSNSGFAKICGKDILTNPKEAKANIGYLPEIPPVYPDMTVLEYLSFVFDLKNVKKSKKEHIDEVLKKVKIDGVKNRLIKNLSKGFRQRVGLAQALIGDPKVLILDEPTVGLDPTQIIEFRNIIKSLKGDHTVILSTHILQEVIAVCDTVTIINDGKVVVSDSISALSAPDGKIRYSLKIKGDSSSVQKAFEKLYDFAQISSKPSFEDNISEVKVITSCDIREKIFNLCAESALPILEFVTENPSLEELFTKVTSSHTSDNQKGGNE